MHENAYRRPSADLVAATELEIKRSRFLGFITRSETEAEARAFIAQLRTEFPDARHHCSAFICHVDDAQPIERSSDDGEPSGTAGFPMLEVLKGSGLQDVVAVVVRYFGGTKLGTGGLVRAYSDSVSLTLSEVSEVQRKRQDLYSFSLPHHSAGKILSELRNREVEILDTNYGAEVELLVGVAPHSGLALGSFLAELTAGTVQPKESGTQWVDA